MTTILKLVQSDTHTSFLRAWDFRQLLMNISFSILLLKQQKEQRKLL